MYENKTYDAILNKMLERMKDYGVDTSEGSLLYSAVAPEAWELSEAYLAIDTVYNNTFADTAPREELILRAKERGLAPKPATHAVLKGAFNMDVPINSRFSLNDLSYTVTEKISSGTYKLQCEKSGTDGNKKFGELIPIQYIPELEQAELVELLIPGEEEEDTESFRARYFNGFNSLAFGGNKADYIEKMKSFSGVGGTKIYRITEQNYNILAVLINSDFKAPSQELVALIQEKMDPTGDGNGVGMAPIGHVVFVQGVAEVPIDINTTITLEEGYVWEDVSEEVCAAIDEYFLNLAQTWETAENLIVRTAQLEAKILDVAGVVDITGTHLNGTAGNIALSNTQIPIRRNLNGNN